MSYVEAYAQLPDLVAAGLTIRDIADELGVSYEAARHALRRRNLKAIPEADMDFRQIVQNMRMSEAVEYLLYSLETLQEAVRAPVKRRRDFPITLYQERMLDLMEYREPNAVSKEALLNAATFDSTSAPFQRTVSVHIHRLRRNMPASYGEIVTHIGTGYSFARP